MYSNNLNQKNQLKIFIGYVKYDRMDDQKFSCDFFEIIQDATKAHSRSKEVGGRY